MGWSSRGQRIALEQAGTNFLLYLAPTTTPRNRPDRASEGSRVQVPPLSARIVKTRQGAEEIEKQSSCSLGDEATNEKRRLWDPGALRLIGGAAGAALALTLAIGRPCARKAPAGEQGGAQDRGRCVDEGHCKGEGGLRRGNWILGRVDSCRRVLGVLWVCADFFSDDDEESETSRRRPSA